VLVVAAKQLPSVDDPALRERAIGERLRELLDRHGAGRLRRLQAV
jgi:hypothetical protein